MEFISSGMCSVCGVLGCRGIVNDEGHTVCIGCMKKKQLRKALVDRMDEIVSLEETIKNFKHYIDIIDDFLEGRAEIIYQYENGEIPR